MCVCVLLLIEFSQNRFRVARFWKVYRSWTVIALSEIVEFDTCSLLLKPSNTIAASVLSISLLTCSGMNSNCRIDFRTWLTFFSLFFFFFRILEKYRAYWLIVHCQNRSSYSKGTSPATDDNRRERIVNQIQQKSARSIWLTFYYINCY